MRLLRLKLFDRPNFSDVLLFAHELYVVRAFQVLGVRKQTSNIAVYGELGRFPLVVLRKIRILKYWFKILNAPESLLYKVYLQQVNQLNINANFECWAAGIRKILNELGFSYFLANCC